MLRTRLDLYWSHVKMDTSAMSIILYLESWYFTSSWFWKAELNDRLKMVLTSTSATYLSSIQCMARELNDKGVTSGWCLTNCTNKPPGRNLTVIL